MTGAKGPKRRSRRGIDGTVYPRGKKWAYAVDLGSDPLTGERRRDSRSGFPSEDAAWEALVEANNKLRTNRYVKYTPRTVRQFLDEWLTSVEISLKPTTHNNYQNCANYYVNPIIGERQLQDVTHETVSLLYAHLLKKGRRKGDSNQRMYRHWKETTESGKPVKPKDLAAAGDVTYSAATRAIHRYEAGRVPKKYSPGLDARTVHGVHIMLCRAFADGVSWKYMTTNPAAEAKRVRQERKGHKVWTPDELRRFLATARRERLYAMWLMFATTGMRRSEAAGARRDLFDATARTMTLWQTRVVAGGRVTDSDGKTRQSRRQLALDRHTADALIRHLETLDYERREFGPAYQDHGMLFCWIDGRPIYPDTISEQFNRLVDRAGLPRITLHDVRHTYATMSLRAGVNPKIVSTRLGHATVAFTLDLYTEDVPELHHTAAETVSGLFLDAVEERTEPPLDLP